MNDLGTLGGTWSCAFSINDSGQVVGGADTTGGVHAFLYSDSTMNDLGTHGGTISEGHSINASGQVVGFSLTTDFANHAFLYKDSAMYDLNTLIDPSSGWRLMFAQDINDAGQIVGYGINGSEQGHAFLLTPIPEPSTLSLLSTVYIWICMYLCRRKK